MKKRKLTFTKINNDCFQLATEESHTYFTRQQAFGLADDILKELMK